MNIHHIYQNVVLGESCHIGAFSSIGLPPRGYEEGELQTCLGNRVEVKTHATICAGNRIGDDVTLGHGLYMRQGSQIGARVSIGSHSNLEWDIIIGDDVVIGSYAGIAEYSILETGTWLGHQVSLPSVLHPLCPKAKECGRGSHLHRAVTVGAGATLYPDLKIGTGALIEPCAVVVADVPPFAVMAGNPARPMGDIFSLYPQVVERVALFVDLSEPSVLALQQAFANQDSLFAAKS